MTNFKSIFLKIDWLILALVFTLSLIGILIIFSSSYNPNLISSKLLSYERQAIFLITWIILAAPLLFFNYLHFKKSTPYLYLFALLILILVLIFGKEINGSKAWFTFLGFGFQPVEIVKLILIICFAKYFSENYHEIHRVKHIFISGIYLTIPLFLVMLQPDLGSAIVLIAIWFGMLLMAGIKVKHFIILMILGVLLVIGSWFFILTDYQKERFQCVTNLDPQNPYCYNTQQSLISIGSGGVFGKGFGYGPQSQLNFLPEKHTDFIYSVLGEEFGFVGTSIVLSIFILLLYRMFLAARKTQNLFGKFILIGIIVFFTGHILINIGMNLGLLPVTGIPLPFLSYGGSSLLSFILSIFLLENIQSRNQ
jgi:rod shape determining protein RodA